MRSIVPFFIVAVFALIGLVNNTSAQDLDTLIYCGIKIVPFNKEFRNEPIEELSGIEYTGKGNLFYVIPQSRSKAHIFLCTINTSNEEIQVEFDSVIYLNHGPLEAESIRVNPLTNQLYISEEADYGVSYVYTISDSQKLEKIYESKLEQRCNSGFEGLCFNKKGDVMYMSLERPLKGFLTQIIAYNLLDSTKTVYSYKLDEVPNDKRNDNGITELLVINDSTLLVVERAFLGKSFGNSIRVYKASIPSTGNEI